MGLNVLPGWILTKDSSLKSTRIGIGEKLLSVDGGSPCSDWDQMEGELTKARTSPLVASRTTAAPLTGPVYSPVCLLARASVAVLNFCIDGEFEITTCFGLRGLQGMVAEPGGINLKELIPCVPVRRGL